MGLLPWLIYLPLSGGRGRGVASILHSEDGEAWSPGSDSSALEIITWAVKNQFWCVCHLDRDWTVNGTGFCLETSDSVSIFKIPTCF